MMKEDVSVRQRMNQRSSVSTKVLTLTAAAELGRSAPPPKLSGTPRLVDLAYERVREMLQEGGLPEVLSEQVLAGQLGFSKTPVREALHRLAQEGLLRMLPRRGYLVPRITASDVQELFEVREALEGMAARLAAQRISELERDVIQDALAAASLASEDAESPENLARMEFANGILHEGLLTAASNTRLLQAMAPLRSQVQRIQRLAVRAPGRIRRSHDEHIDVFAAVGRRDPDGAEHAMRAHIRSTGRDVLGQLR
jgi:GntR family transcriptional regulator, rspAB operon transcriptional repressor